MRASAGENVRGKFSSWWSGVRRVRCGRYEEHVQEGRGGADRALCGSDGVDVDLSKAREKMWSVEGVEGYPCGKVLLCCA